MKREYRFLRGALSLFFMCTGVYRMKDEKFNAVNNAVFV